LGAPLGQYLVTDFQVQAARWHIHGDHVAIAELEARVTDEVKPGILYTTFHFPEAMVNNVTGQGCDADTMCPEYKVIAADVEFVSAGKPKKKRMMEMG
jgi:predicted molibdopterin-dependent oxidoreductase YjgC